MTDNKLQQTFDMALTHAHPVNPNPAPLLFLATPPRDLAAESAIFDPFHDLTPPPRDLAAESAIFKLPPELRNEIYKYLVDEQPVMRPLDPRWQGYWPAPIALTCRQIHNEVSQVFYGRVTWHITIRPWRDRFSRERIQRWLRGIGEHNRKALKTLVLKLHFYGGRHLLVRICLRTWGISLRGHGLQAPQGWEHPRAFEMAQAAWRKAVADHFVVETGLTLEGWHQFFLGLDRAMFVIRVPNSTS